MSKRLFTPTRKQHERIRIKYVEVVGETRKKAQIYDNREKRVRDILGEGTFTSMEV